MPQQKSLHRSIAALLAGGSLLAGAAEAGLMPNSSFNFSLSVNGSPAGSAVASVDGSGDFSAGFFVPPSSAVGVTDGGLADIRFNFLFTGITAGTLVSATLTDMEFVGGEELTGLTQAAGGAVSGIGSGPVFSFTPSSLTVTYVTNGTFSLFDARYNFITQPAGPDPEPIPAPPSLALLGLGLAGLGWRRRQAARDRTSAAAATC